MVDALFHRGVAQEGSEQTSRGPLGDLLADLARLTGQGDPCGDGARDGGSSRPDWAEDDTSSEQRQQGQDHDVAHWRPQLSPVSPERSKQKPPSTRHFSRPAVKFNGFPGEASDHRAAANKVQYSHAGRQASSGRNDRQPVFSSPRAPTLLPTVSYDRHTDEMQAAETDETHGAYRSHDALPRARWRLVTIVVLGLAWLGVASAFLYHAVFEEALLPTLPTLMAAENGPKKIVPNYGDARPINSRQTSIESAVSSEKFALRWPADNQEPPKTALISPNPSTPRPAVPLALADPASPPAVAPSALMAPSVPASHSLEPKKIHTVIIRSDGSEQTDTPSRLPPTARLAPGAKPSTAAAP